jgi:hypothetical protein
MANAAARLMITSCQTQLEIAPHMGTANQAPTMTVRTTASLVVYIAQPATHKLGIVINATTRHSKFTNTI